jgi:hypothetical protein
MKLDRGPFRISLGIAVVLGIVAVDTLGDYLRWPVAYRLTVIGVAPVGLILLWLIARHRSRRS